MFHLSIVARRFSSAFGPPTESVSDGALLSLPLVLQHVVHPPFGEAVTVIWVDGSHHDGMSLPLALALMARSYPRIASIDLTGCDGTITETAGDEGWQDYLLLVIWILLLDTRLSAYPCLTSEYMPFPKPKFTDRKWTAQEHDAPIKFPF
jgi:hypothetical protein